MTTWQRVLAYAAIVLAVFVVAFGIGRLVGPIGTDDGQGAGRVHPAAATSSADAGGRP